MISYCDVVFCLRILFLCCCVCTDKGEVYTWGWGGYGLQGLGPSSLNEDALLPTPLRCFDGRVVSIACGYYHNVACTGNC